MIPLDPAWRRANPLPSAETTGSKEERGRVGVVGGAVRVPGAVALTAEAALRVGAGKVQIATLNDAALPLGIAFPECAVVPLGERDGQIDPDAIDPLLDTLDRIDVLAVGSGMGSRAAAGRLVRRLADAFAADRPLLLDAAAIACLGEGDRLPARAGGLVLTPHAGEMAALLGCDADYVARHAPDCAGEAAEKFGATLVLKGRETVIAHPDGTQLHYPGGGPGLGTGGSGDVLAGVIAGLMARGADPLVAAGWGVWLHGSAGRVLADRVGPVGFLARELLAELPRLLAD